MEAPKGSVGIATEMEATPERVLKAIHALTAAAAVFGVQDGITVTVQNQRMCVRLNGWTNDAATATAEIYSFARNPAASKLAPERAVGLSRALRPAIDELSKQGSTRLVAKGNRRIDVNAVLVAAMKGIEEMQPEQPDPPTLCGTTVVHTHVLQVGRLAEQPRWSARIRVGSSYVQVPMEADLVASMLGALQGGNLMEVRIYATWVLQADAAWDIDFKRSNIVGASPSPRIEPAPGSWSRLPAVLTLEEVGAMVDAGAEEWDE